MISDLRLYRIEPPVKTAIETIVGLGLKMRLMRRARDDISTHVKHGIAAAAITPPIGHVLILAQIVPTGCKRGPVDPSRTQPVRQDGARAKGEALVLQLGFDRVHSEKQARNP